MRGRFAPSPSGELHLGNVWTALLSWLQVRKEGGAFILRMEDLDPDRSIPAFAGQILEDLRWLGLDWDEGPDIGGPHAPYNQDARRSLYAEALDRLERMGLVYPCYCTRKEIRNAAQAPHQGEDGLEYTGTCRRLTRKEREAKGNASGLPPTLRLMTPDEGIAFTDLLQGPQRQNIQREVGDFILRRRDGVHAYQLAVVVDDGAMGITHVLRGADLLPSTARQILLCRLLGLPEPVYAHVPLLLAGDGQRLAKRFGARSMAQLRQKGVRPTEIIGYLAWLANLLPAWEEAAPRDLIPLFSLDRLPRQNLVIDLPQRLQP